jgi:hypothetical protein
MALNINFYPLNDLFAHANACKRKPPTSSFFLVPTYCMCRGLLLHLIMLNGTYTPGRTPLDERQTYMPPVGFKPTILPRKKPPNNTLDRVATGISPKKCNIYRQQGASLHF